jgi:hypothetical protein
MTEATPFGTVAVNATARARRSTRVVTATVMPENTIGSTQAGLIGANTEKIASRGTGSMAAMGLPRFASAVGAVEGGMPLAVSTGSLWCAEIVHGCCHPGVLDRQSFTGPVSRKFRV